MADAEGFGETAREITGDQVKNYAYRADGKIASFQSGNLSVNYFYDGLDRLVAKAVNENGNQYTQSVVYLGNENRVLLGKSGDGSITTYIDGQDPAEHLGEVKNGVGKGYITDHLGSVLNAAPAGSWMTYGLLGEPAAKPGISQTAPAKEFAYAGYSYRREDGGYDTDNRIYNPAIGRWLSQDPIGYKAKDPNYYRYVLNNPLIYTDPDGLRCRRIQRVGMGIIGAGAVGAYFGQVHFACAAAVIGAGTVIYGEYADCPDETPGPTPTNKNIIPNEKDIDDALGEYK